MIPQQIDPPEQTRYRRILDPHFSRRRMQQIEGEVRAHARALIDAVEAQGSCEFDAAFAVPLPCSVFLTLMGLPREELALFLELKDGIIRPEARSGDPRALGTVYDRLAPELLREVLHIELPAYSEARVESADLTDLRPAEYRADLVVLLYEGTPVLGIVIEVQLQPDHDKRFSWPMYVTGLRARIGCPVCLLVVTADDAVAAWASAMLIWVRTNRRSSTVRTNPAPTGAARHVARHADPLPDRDRLPAIQLPRRGWRADRLQCRSRPRHRQLPRIHARRRRRHFASVAPRRLPPAPASSAHSAKPRVPH